MPLWSASARRRFLSFLGARREAAPVAGGTLECVGSTTLSFFVARLSPPRRKERKRRRADALQRGGRSPQGRRGRPTCPEGKKASSSRRTPWGVRPYAAFLALH